MMSSIHKVIISVNPKAGRCSPMLRAEELSGRLREKGFAVELLTDLDEVTEKAKIFHAEGRLRSVVGVGGDGTAATLVNRTEPGTPITLLAAGTANLLAKHFRLGKSPKRLAEIIETGKVQTLDAGRVHFSDAERIFL
ncbi:MAG: acylglycerol kinase family protein, partial [Planctomycetaceae bacterium]|nr:acylglycerol kinase family protein [Planctomycetaceae bacterium]